MFRAMSKNTGAGQLLRAYRLNRPVRADKLARDIGVDRSTLTRYETDKIEIPAERVLRIEALTGISRHELRPDVYGPPLSAKASAAG